MLYPLKKSFPAQNFNHLLTLLSPGLNWLYFIVKAVAGGCNHRATPATYERSLKDDTSYLDKMYHLTAIRCYIFRRKPVYVDFY